MDFLGNRQDTLSLTYARTLQLEKEIIIEKEVIQGKHKEIDKKYNIIQNFDLQMLSEQRKYEDIKKEMSKFALREIELENRENRIIEILKLLEIEYSKLNKREEALKEREQEVLEINKPVLNKLEELEKKLIRFQENNMIHV